MGKIPGTMFYENNNKMKVYGIKTDKFKTNTINIYFDDMLSKENAAVNALLPAVLRRGCQGYPKRMDISKRLEELYGAAFDVSVDKKGERQIIQFYMEYVNEKVTGEKKGETFKSCLELLSLIIGSPLIDKNTFPEEYINQEKNNLVNLIKSRINDKATYAVDRCFECMCSQEPYGIYEYGTVEGVEAISSEQLINAYNRLKNKMNVVIFMTGDIEMNMLEMVSEKFTGIFGRGGSDPERSTPASGATPESNVTNINSAFGASLRQFTEKMDVSQAKLSIGFRTGIDAKNGYYHALLLANSIYGMGVHSKLFRIVREKENLCYYVYSRLEKFKGLMIATSGINAKDKDKALDIILAQLDEVKKGNIDDYELDFAKKYIQNGIKSMSDNQNQMADFYHSQMIANTDDTMESLVEKVMKLDKSIVSEAASRINADTVFYLEPAQAAEEGRQ